MTLLCLLRLALVPITLVVVAVLLRLALISLQQALHAGVGEALMMAWVLFFVVGLPVLLLTVPLAGAFQAHRSRSGIVPHAGVKIP